MKLELSAEFLEEGAILLTSQAARLLDVAPETVRAWCRAGKLRAFRTAGGVRLFRRADVQRLADARHVTDASVDSLNSRGEHR